MASSNSRLSTLDYRLSTFPVRPHQLARPLRLPDGIAGQEFLHDGFDVQHRRSVNRIELRDMQRTAIALQYAHDGTADAIGTVLAALREDPDTRPRGVVARMSSPAHDLPRIHLIEIEDDLRVRERVDPQERIGVEPVCQDDRGVDPTPVIVAHVYALRSHVCHGFHHNHRYDSCRAAAPHSGGADEVLRLLEADGVQGGPDLRPGPPARN